MLLKRTIHNARAAAEAGDRGAAMVAVLGVLAMGMILTALIGSTIVGGIGYSSSSRAGIQSQAAAEAGLAVARAGIEAGTCSANGGVYASAPGDAPEYRAVVWRQTASGTWEQGCPVSSTQPMRIISGGDAADLGVAGLSGNDDAFVEAVFAKPTTPTEINASGPAVFAYSSTGFGGSGNLVSVDGNEPDVLVRTGDVDCDGAAAGVNHLVVQDGNLRMRGSCNISGNVWATGTVTIEGGVTVGGNVVGNGVSFPNGTVNGSIWSTAGLTMSGGARVKGNVTAQSFTFNGGTVEGSAWVYGTSSHRWGSLVQGNVTARTISTESNTLIQGSRTQVPGGPGPSPWPMPESPIVPEWYDFVYNIDHWTGFGEVVLTGNCNFAAFQGAVSALAGAPGVIDARTCTDAVSISEYQKLNLKNDLVIISNRFNLGGSGGFTADDDSRLWLITPDTVVNQVPDCPSGSYFSIGGGFTFATNIDVMMYTPCQVTIGSSTKFNGQIFAGRAGIAGGAQIGYVPVGLPGVNLNTGASQVTSPANQPWQVVSVRNRPDAG